MEIERLQNEETTYKLIQTFVENINKQHGDGNHVNNKGIRLYYRLTSRISFSPDNEFVKDIMNSFKTFYVKNRDTILKKEHDFETSTSINFQEEPRKRIFINVPFVFKNSSDVEANVVWEFLFLIFAHLETDPETSNCLVELAKNISLSDGSSKGGFLKLAGLLSGIGKKSGVDTNGLFDMAKPFLQSFGGEEILKNIDMSKIESIVKSEKVSKFIELMKEKMEGEGMSDPKYIHLSERIMGHVMNEIKLLNDPFLSKIIKLSKEIIEEVKSKNVIPQ
jgi:hypothetical protein